ncbi:MAG: hypothetical protein KTR30_00865 [Saprospiraceae bacterium]|nr:hypothetical protein [Saprospiraceae bacterium]
MRANLLFVLLLFYGCHKSIPDSNIPGVNLLKGVFAYPDTFTNKIEMIYECRLHIENGKEDIWFLTSSPKGDLYAHTNLEITKAISPDSMVSYAAIIDRVGHNYRLEAGESKSFLVKIRDFSDISIVPDTIAFNFRYYRDSNYFDMWQMKVSVPVKAQLVQK